MLAAAATAVSSLAATGTGATTIPGTPGTGVPAPPALGVHHRLTDATATRIFLEDRKVASWLKRYPDKPQKSATWKDGVWSVVISTDGAGAIASGKVDDALAVVTEAWTGPQVAWTMARGQHGAFGGAMINSKKIWLVFCVVFLLGLVNWRRPFSVRTLDLLALLSFSVSLWYFNAGDVLMSAPLVYPPFVWLLIRCFWVGARDRPSKGDVVWPVWLLLAATVFLGGFRIGLNVRDSNVIDVGYSGVIGADRIWHGQSPYDHFPVERERKACGPADSNGEIRDRIQTNGRCESANERGDTYGPVAYEAYLPGYLLFGWSGKWDSLPSVHFTSIVWDLLALVGMGLVGLRLGGPKLGATFAFAWAAWPFTQYASSSNTNDMIGPALLVIGFLFYTSSFRRGVFSALAGWTKFGSLLLVPLWAGYPDARRFRGRAAYTCGFLVATGIAFSVLLLEPSPFHAARVFVDRTVIWQSGRDSPFSIWDYRQYHAKGLPDLHRVQALLEIILIAGALALGRWPRRRSPLRLAAFSAVLLIGFEIVLTHWYYPYLLWMFPFVAITLLMPRQAPEPDGSVDAGHEPAPTMAVSDAATAAS
ncbi:unannotated protein [freshwater metagenome]|uniref:Unannotated protein n=1 Tax=freshwater metagenome TaxID=449393 RepID=A0A6J6QAD6_9ZZZZ